MIPKRNRVNTKLIDLIFKEGNCLFSNNINLKFFFNKENPDIKVAFITPKSTFKKASERNLFRRKGYSLIYKHLNNIPKGFSGAFIFNPKSKNNLIFVGENKNSSLSGLEKDIIYLIDKIKNI